MSLHFRYQLIRFPFAIPTLGDRWVRPRPIFSLALVGPTGTVAIDSLLDSGADDTVFPETLAARVGLDLTHAPRGQARGAGVAAVPLRYAQVIMRLTDGHEFREWPAWVGFTPVPLSYPMLGFVGFLQFFEAQLLGDREEVILTVNSLYPGR